MDPIWSQICSSLSQKHHQQVEISEQKKLILLLDQAFNSEQMMLCCSLGRARGNENCTIAKAVIKLSQGFDIIHQNRKKESISTLNSSSVYCLSVD